VVAVNGPEHYREAEIRLAEAALQRRGGFLEDAACEAAMAQVHATLALAAATASADVLAHHFESEDEANAWARATTPTTPTTPSRKDSAR
jgi:hypothetical protein